MSSIYNKAKGAINTAKGAITGKDKKDKKDDKKDDKKEDKDDKKENSGPMVSTDSKIEFYVSFILRGRIKHKMDEVMNKTYCNLIQTLLENKQIKDAIKDKAVKILERVTFVGDLEKAISTLNPRYIRKRNQSNCKRTKNTPGISHMISASSSVMDFVSKSGDKLKNTFKGNIDKDRDKRLRRTIKHNILQKRNKTGKRQNLIQEANEKRFQNKMKERPEATVGGFNPLERLQNFKDDIKGDIENIKKIPSKVKQFGVDAKQGSKDYANRISGEEPIDKATQGSINDTFNNLSKTFETDKDEFVQIFTDKFKDADTINTMKNAVDHPDVKRHICGILDRYLIKLLDPKIMRDLLLKELENIKLDWVS